MLYFEIESTFTDVSIAPTLFFYGHFDKQPHFEGWKEGTGPTDPKIIDGKLYGRGCSDDGYALYSILLAIKTCQKEFLMDYAKSLLKEVKKAVQKTYHIIWLS